MISGFVFLLALAALAWFGEMMSRVADRIDRHRGE